MKKLLIWLIALGVLAPAITMAYTVKRGDTLSSIARTFGVSVDSLVKDNGIVDKNLIYIGQNINTGDKLLGAIPLVVAVYTDSLASRISSSASTMTLVRGTDKQSRSLNGYYGFVIDEGTASEEFVLANCVATACTFTTRGIDVVDGKTSVTALKFEHRRSAEVKISNFPQLAVLSRILNGDESASSTFKYGDGNTVSTTSKCIIVDNGTTNLPKLCYNEATSKFLLYNDGINSYDITAGGSGLTAGKGITINSGVVSITTNTSTAATGYVGTTLAVVTSSNGGLTNYADGLGLATTTPIVWGNRQNFASASTSLNYFSFATGTTNQYNVTFLPTPTALTQGTVYRFMANATSTASSTLKVNGLGAQFIKRNGLNTGYGDIGKNQVTTVIWDGTNFQLENPVPTYPATLIPLPAAGILATSTYDNMTAREARYALVNIPYDIEIKKISMSVATFTSSVTSSFAIYSADGQTQIYSTTTPLITGTGLQQWPLPAGTSIKLPAGQYYLGFATVKAAAFVPIQWRNAYDMNSIIGSVTGGIDYMGYITNGASPNGFLPSTFDPTALNIFGIENNFPIYRFDN